MIRTKYCQSLMDSTYAGVAVEAIKNGWDGAWERLIANKLLLDYHKGVSEAEVIMAYAFDTGIKSKAEAAVKGAFLITSSTIQTHEQTT